MSWNALDLARESVRSLSPYVPGKPVEALEREYGITQAVKLASNENPLGAGERARAALRDLGDSLGRYPDGGGFELRGALAALHGVAASQVTLGNGSNDVLDLVARAFAGPGDEIVFSAHAFAVYPIVTAAAGATAVEAPSRDWGHDLDAMAAAIGPRTRVVFVANPNNPTGTWLARGPLEAFVRALPERVIVVIDEAYAEYVAQPEYPDCTAWVARHPNVVATRTFSKVHGLAALRVGYGVSHESVADVLNRVRQPFNVNSLGLAAARAALEDTEHLRRSREVNAAGLAQLEAGARSLGLSWIPSVANFITLDLGRPAAPVYEALLRAGVIVRPVANYGMPRHLRVSVGLAGENARCLEALERALRG